MGCSTTAADCHKIVAMPLIKFEGCGKSAQVKGLAVRLKKERISPLVLREPGETAVGEAIRDLLQHSEESHGIIAETELLLVEASQDAARNLDPQLVKSLNGFAAGDRVPDLTFMLDIDRGTAQSRRAKRTKIRYRLEEESEAFPEHVIQACRKLAKNEPKRVVQIDCRLSADAIEQHAWHQLVNRFPVLASYQSSKISHQSS
jgi:dTMP kinase